jgi:uncharacterized membrane protein YeaQ/YmgE (transglycosylase-associated protein family)
VVVDATVIGRLLGLKLLRVKAYVTLLPAGHEPITYVDARPARQQAGPGKEGGNLSDAARPARPRITNHVRRRTHHPLTTSGSAGSPKEHTMIGLIISLILIGLVAGALARLLVPGRQDISIPMTILIGIIGSFVGGFLGYLIFHKDSQDGFFQPSGIIGSIIGAVIVLLVWMRVGGRSSIRR